ncbi:TolC family protein [Caldimonas brevitalea]|uniref:TolC family protein n=1 Tax=Caldimonas brevitalea TaxID=413882 RepID=UPI0014700A6F|nr:TolC family protein [Caldimonas brevitalea]
MLLLLWSMLSVAVPVRAQPLAALEAWAVAAAPEQRLAEAELEVLRQRAAAAAAEPGARAFGSLSYSDNREPTDDRTVRDYRQAAGQLGLRWPLLGDRQAAERQQADARAAVEVAGWRRREVEADVKRLVATAYLQVLYSQRRLRLIEAFLSDETSALAVLAARQQARLLLEADRLGFASMFDLARREQAREQALHAEAETQLARLTGRKVAPLQPQQPPLEVHCLTREALQARAEHDPAVARAAAEVETRRRLLGLPASGGVEAGLSVAQRYSRDMPGQSGSSAVVAVDVSVPLAWRAARDAQRGVAMAELTRADLALESRLAEHRLAVERGVADLELRARDVASATRQRDAAFEAWRVARLRAHRLDGDVLERELQTRYALLQASLDGIASRHRHDLARYGLVALHGSPCATQPTAASPPGQPDTAPLEPQVLAALSGMAPAQRRAAAVAASPGTAPLAWFAWRIAPLLALGGLDRLPPATRRLMVSFSGTEIRALGQPQAAQVLRQFLALAHARGLTVELLLGDPTWVRPDARPRLLALITQLRGFEFDGLNLDLERSQLPAAQQADWSQRVVETIAAVRAVTPLPVALTTHHREFQDRTLVEQLVAAGLSEAVLMVYVTREQRVVEIARPLLAAHPQLPIAIAQSIEPELPATESSHQLGQRASLERWRRLDTALSGHANFNGVVVQSWEAFGEAPP